MQLQIALDRLPAAEALRIAAEVAPFADIIEVGTSLIKAFGMPIVREVASAGGGTPVLADLKTADDARTEFELAYDAGARSATVLGLAARSTVHTCVAVAAERDQEVVVDLMELTPDGRAVLAAELPQQAVLAAHVPKDAQHGGAQVADLVGSWAHGRRLAVAGGLGLADVPRLARMEEELELEWLRIIVGSAVTKAPDVRNAAEQFARAAGNTVEVTR